MTMGFFPSLLILLLALPAAAAIIVACLGPGRAQLVRQISLGSTVASAVIALVLALGFMAERAGHVDLHKKYRPEFVPGATANNLRETTWNLIDFSSAADAKAGKKLGAIQFFIGVDGMNIWLVVLTAILMVSSVLISWTSITERV